MWSSSAADRQARPPRPILRAARPQRRAARQGWPHQALRRRNSAAPDPRFRHSSHLMLKARVSYRDHGLAEGRARRHADRRRLRRHGRPRRIRRIFAASAPSAPARCASSEPIERLTREADGTVVVRYRPKGEAYESAISAQLVIGADGALTRGRTAGSQRGRPDALRLRLSRDRRDARTSGRTAARYSTRRLVARFLRLDFPARRNHERRRRLGAQGIFAKGLGSFAQTPEPSLPRSDDDPQGRRARSRSSRSSDGTMAATCCSPETPRASSRPPPARASITRCSGAAWRPRPSSEA